MRRAGRVDERSKLAQVRDGAFTAVRMLLPPLYWSMQIFRQQSLGSFDHLLYVHTVPGVQLVLLKRNAHQEFHEFDETQRLVVRGHHSVDHQHQRLDKRPFDLSQMKLFVENPVRFTTVQYEQLILRLRVTALTIDRRAP